jgi:hypothetical protein
MAQIKWYWWVLLGLAILMTIYVVFVSAKTNPKKVESKLVSKEPNLLATASTSSYQTIGNIAEKTINPGEVQVA